MAPTRQEAINDAYERLKDVWFTMEPIFAEHGPMAAEAMSTLGRNGSVAAWVEAYKANHRHLPPPPAQERIDPADESQWRAALGATRRMSDWLDLFRRELAERAWQETIRIWVPRLIDGCAGGLTHGLIRTAHAVRALPEEGAPSEREREELARGLAYWAAVYQPPAGDAPSTTNAVDAPGDAGAAISRHTARFAHILLAQEAAQAVPLIQLVHTITSAAATRNFLPLLPPAFGAQASRRLDQVATAIAARVTRAPVPDAAPTAEIGEPLFGIDELIDRAVAHGDEHVIKLTEACLREDRIKPDPVYRAVAEMLQRRVPPGA